MGNILLNIILLLGSLGLFLFGMRLMSESLQKFAGFRFRKILSKVINKPFQSIIAGTVITGTVQSSSAITVMIISFVNAGLIKLKEAVALIMGANIGTTITIWLISILGFSNIDIKLFAISFIGLGFPLLISRKIRTKSVGEFIIGLSVLFLGLEYIKDAVPPLEQTPELIEFLSSYTGHGYWSVLLFVFFGLVLTIIIQSSSATTALTLVMVFKGWISFDLAAAMILGENIGTTITPNIAALVANNKAKTAARAHFVINFLGVIWMLILFIPFLKAVDFFIETFKGASPFNDEYSVALGLAIFHTSFNIINTLIFVSFIPQIIRISEKLVRNKENEKYSLKFFSTGLLSTSELSIVQAKRQTITFSKVLIQMIDIIPDLLTEKRDKHYKKLLQNISLLEKRTDNFESEIAIYLTKLSSSDLSYEGSKRIQSFMKIIDDMESIGDVCYQISLTIHHKNKEKVWFSQEIRDKLNEVFNITKNALLIMHGNLKADLNDIDLKKAAKTETTLNEFWHKSALLKHKELKKAEHNKRAITYFNDIIILCVKMGDYAVNVSETLAD